MPLTLPLTRDIPVSASYHAPRFRMSKDFQPESTFSLLERAREGDREAIELLVARHRPPLQRWASGRLPRWARDMVDTQEDRKSTRLNSSHIQKSRMPSSA